MLRRLRTAASVRRLVLAGLTAGLAVHQAVGAEAHIELGLAVDAEFVARASGFELLALGANDAADAWFSGHESSVERLGQRENVTEVTGKSEVRSQIAEVKPRFQLRSLGISGFTSAI